jgi:hypothetical protein
MGRRRCGTREEDEEMLSAVCTVQEGIRIRWLTRYGEKMYTVHFGA